MKGKTIKIELLSAALAFTFAVVPLVPAAAQDIDTPLTYGDTVYACTGIGLESRENPEWRNYPLRLEFASANAKYVAEVSVRIDGAAGDPVLEANCYSPWLVAKLPAGSYKVTAVWHGKTESVTANVPASGQARVIVRFPEDAT